MRNKQSGIFQVLPIVFASLILISCKNDYAKKLSGHIQTIEVQHINWACDCPDFIETWLFKDDSTYTAKDDDCIFIEAAKSSLKVPESFYSIPENYNSKVLRLTGQFYLDEGISRTYEQKTPQKPEKARVFRYDKLEILDKK